MRRVLALGAVLICSLGFGCLWDSDTVAAELKGLPELQDVIAGRFERNPDLYYEMRLARIEKEGASFPEGYFDAAVACDRLGKQDEAIKWMDKQNKASEVIARYPSREARLDYSYKRAANLGTFYIHRGLKKGQEGLADMKKGLGLIEEAIEINPEAHFGREKVQAALVRQMIWQRGLDARVAKLKSEGKDEEAHKVGMEDPPATGLSKQEIREEVIGLMVLGNAWEAPVAWEWLAGTYDQKDSHAGELINARIQEIEPGRERIYEGLPEPLRMPIYNPYDEERTREIYSKLRMNGKEWADAREKFLSAKLNAGKHPDTDADFWSGYTEVPQYQIVEIVPGGKIDPVAEATRGVLMKVGSCCGLTLGAVGVIVWGIRRRKSKQNSG